MDLPAPAARWGSSRSGLVVGTVVTGRARAAVRLPRRRPESAPTPVPAGRWLSFSGLAVLAIAMAGPTVDVRHPFRRHGHRGHRRLPEHDGHGRRPQPARSRQEGGHHPHRGAARQRGHRCRGVRGRAVDAASRLRTMRGPAAVARLTSGGTSLGGGDPGLPLRHHREGCDLAEEGARAPDLGTGARRPSSWSPTVSDGGGERPWPPRPSP